MIMLQKILTF